MIHHRVPSILAGVVVLIGASVIAIAQMGPNDSRVLPYSGTLEVNGVVGTDTYDMRFGLFSSPTADPMCLLIDPATCPWGEEQVVDVVAGRFSVVLGTSTTLDDSVLAQDRLFLAIAVRGPNDNGVFSALAGLQEILPVPFASRAAAANDYKIVGALTVGDPAGSGVEIDDGVMLLHNAAVPDRFVRLDGNEITSMDGAGTHRRLFVQGDPVSVEGPLEVSGSTTVNGTATFNSQTTVNAGLRFECMPGWTRYGSWCIEDVMRGSAGVTYNNAINQCDSIAAQVCPLAALMTCDNQEVGAPAGNTCAFVTDAAQWLWAARVDGNDTNAFAQIGIYSGMGNDTTDEIDVTNASNTTGAGTPIAFYCCRNAGGL